MLTVACQLVVADQIYSCAESQPHCVPIIAIFDVTN